MRQLATSALEGGSVGVTSVGVCAQAHDPVRYVGDMLAWVHQALASERDLLETLVVPRTHAHAQATAEAESAHAPPPAAAQAGSDGRLALALDQVGLSRWTAQSARTESLVPTGPAECIALSHIRL